MPLNTGRLVMVGLGVLGDQPPNTLQPPLVDGIHLRYQPQRELGFPWYGFYLFRRESQPGKPICMGANFAHLPVGPWTGPTLQTTIGTITSDRTLVLTDDFAASGAVEVDLDGRGYVDVDLAAPFVARRAEVTIGLRQNVGRQEICIDFKDLAAGAGPNPRRVAGATFAVHDLAGATPPTTVKDWRTRRGLLRGLDCGERTFVHLPCTADSVELTLTHFARPARVAALDERGAVLTTATMSAPSGVPEVVKLAHPGIAQVVIQCLMDETALHRLCFGCVQPSRSVIRVTALAGSVPVGSVDIGGTAGQVVKASLAFDGITALRVSPGKAALIDVCVVPLSQGATSGWQSLKGAPEPMCLPVRHPNYPCNSGPVDLAGSRATALARILYGPSAPWSGQPFTDLHEVLLELVGGGPTGAPMWQHTKHLTGIETPPDPGVDPPDMPDLVPLDLVLLAALSPAVAQMLGLYWVDQDADPTKTYDYLVVADYQGMTGTGAAGVLQHIQTYGFALVEASIVSNLRKAPAPPLGVPAGTEVYALPGGTIAAQGGGIAAAAFTAGVRWSLPTTSTGFLTPGSAVMYHVWRADLGTGATPAVPVAYAPLTAASAVLVANPLSGIVPSWPTGWPPFQLYYADNGLAEGWYGYAVSGIDIFGRHSANSPAASWREWAPMPDPRPWYYQDPPSNAVIHPSAVQLLDKTGPPIPAAVEAYALDPADPTVLRDAAYLAWFATLSVMEQTTLIGLRVRWQWTKAHMDQAPDTAEFRIYFNPGSTPPTDPSLPTSWATRYYIVPYANHVLPAATDDDGNPLFKYDVFIPAAGDASRASVPLVPSQATPVSYANVGVSAADDKAHTADDPKWGAGSWGGRAGNEGRVGTGAMIFVVLRTPPQPPVPVTAGQRVWASRADYHSHSFYTFRWAPQPNLKAHVFRALDDSLFTVDRVARPATALAATDLQYFPAEAADARWNGALRQQVATEINQLNTFPKTTAGDAAADAYYSGLSDDAIRVLAGLPGNEKAFSQITIQPLDPANPSTVNRRGPDTPDTVAIDPTLRAYIDTLDGRSANRYLYRAAYVDGAHNRSAPGLADPPVYLPDVVAPRTPVITRVTLADASVTLVWASNRETDLQRYDLYRSEDERTARDIRTMTLVHSEAVAVADPASRPAEVSWDDGGVVGGFRYYYRLIAADGAGNVSSPSPPASVKAVDTRPPAAPAWTQTKWVLLRIDGTEEPWPAGGVIPAGRRPALRLMWSSDVAGGSFTVTRKARGENLWRPLPTVGPYVSTSASDYLLYDDTVAPDKNYSYRVLATSAAGVRSLEPHEIAVARPR